MDTLALQAEEKKNVPVEKKEKRLHGEGGRNSAPQGKKFH